MQKHLHNLVSVTLRNRSSSDAVYIAGLASMKYNCDAAVAQIDLRIHRIHEIHFHACIQAHNMLLIHIGTA